MAFVETDALKRALQVLGVKAAQVLAERLSDDTITLVIDHGTAGATKHVLELDKLPVIRKASKRKAS